MHVRRADTQPQRREATPARGRKCVEGMWERGPTRRWRAAPRAPSRSPASSIGTAVEGRGEGREGEGGGEGEGDTAACLLCLCLLNGRQPYPHRVDAAPHVQC